MNVAAGRAAIVAALNSVDGVTAYLKKPSPAKAGDAWLRWRADQSEGGGVWFDFTWTVALLVPNSEAGADAWVDDHLSDVLDALRPVTTVRSFEPANFGSEASPVLGLLITTERE